MRWMHTRRVGIVAATAVLIGLVLAAGGAAMALQKVSTGSQACGTGLGITIGAEVLEGNDAQTVAPEQIGRIGDSVMYEVTVSDQVSGSSPACPVSNVTASLTLPNGTTQTLATGDSLTSGEQRVYDEAAPAYLIVQSDLTSNGTLLAKAAVSGVATQTSGSLEPVSATTTFEVPVIHPETVLTKSASVDTGTVPLSVTYTFTEKNISVDAVPGAATFDAISDVAVTDAGTGGCTPPATPVSGDANGNGLLDPGESWVFQCSTTLTSAGTFTDQASATGLAADGRQAGTASSSGAPAVEESNQVTVTADLPPLSIVKTAMPPSGSSVDPGSSIVYSLTVTNSTSKAFAGVVVSDEVPVGTTFVAATDGGTDSGGTVTWKGLSVPAQGSIELSFTVTVDSTDTNGLIITNYAQIVSPCATPGAGSCLSNVVNHTVVTPIVNVTKNEVSPGNGSGVMIGQTISYQLDATNSGGADASSIVITDSIPKYATYVPGSATCGSAPDCHVTFANGVITWTLSKLAAGTSDLLPFEVTVSPCDCTARTIVNQAQFTDVHTPSCTPGVTAATCLTNAVSNPLIFPIIDVTEAESQPGAGDAVKVGEVISYGLSISNTGQAQATNVVVTDHLSKFVTYVAGSASCGGAPSCQVSFASDTLTWNLSTVAAGATETFSFSTKVAPWAVKGTVISNKASFSKVNTPSCTRGLSNGTCLTGTMTNTAGSAKAAASTSSSVAKLPG